MYWTHYLLVCPRCGVVSIINTSARKYVKFIHTLTHYMMQETQCNIMVDKAADNGD